MDVTVDNPLKNDLKRRCQYVKHNIWPFRVPETLYEQPTYTALNSYIPLQSYTPVICQSKLAHQWLKDERNSNERRTVLPKIKAQDRELV